MNKTKKIKLTEIDSYRDFLNSLSNEQFYFFIKNKDEIIHKDEIIQRERDLIKNKIDLLLFK